MIPNSQKPPKQISTAIKTFLIIAVPILLIIMSIRLVMSYEFFAFEYNRADFPIDFYGFTKEDRLEYAPYGINYLLNAEDIDYLGDLRLPLDKCWRPTPNATDCPMFEEGALQHMVDVKVVTETTYIIGFAVSLITAGLLGIAYRYPIYRFAVQRGLTYGSIFTLSLIAMVIVMATVAWDFFFDTFHEIFFAEGTWRFAFSDTLIRLFPERFWFDASITIGIFTVIGASVILVLMWHWSRRMS